MEERRNTEKMHLIDIKKKNTERTVPFTVLQFNYTVKKPILTKLKKRHEKERENFL